MLVLILGDCHGNLDQVHEACMQARQQSGIEAAIQVGDFGFCQKVISRFLDHGRPFPVPLHVIDGNHEDHHWLHEARMNGAVDKWKHFNLFFHARGSVDRLDGCVVGYLGGALHADRRQEWQGQWTPPDGRVPHHKRPVVPKDPAWSNWVTDGDCERAISAFNAAVPDLVVTHSCPAGLRIGMVGDPALIEDVGRFIRSAGFQSSDFYDCGESALTRIWTSLVRRPSIWVFGHFHCLHERVIEGTRFVCVGSTDDSDRVSGIRPVFFDTGTHRLHIHPDVRLAQP